MALHPNFPEAPYAILDPAIRWFPADEALRESSSEKLMPPLVPQLRKKVKEWRDSAYVGAADTSCSLLNWWLGGIRNIDEECVGVNRRLGDLGLVPAVILATGQRDKNKEASMKSTVLLLVVGLGQLATQRATQPGAPNGPSCDAVAKDVKTFIGQTVVFYAKELSFSTARDKDHKVVRETATYICTTSDGSFDKDSAAVMIDSSGVAIGQSGTLLLRGTVDRSESVSLDINSVMTVKTVPFLIKARVEKLGNKR